MNPIDLLAAVRTLGASITVRGDRLRFRSPAGAISAELRASLAEHRVALFEAFKDPECQSEEVSWRLSRDGPGWAAVRSNLIGEMLVFIRDSTVRPPSGTTDRVTYTRAELATLVGASPQLVQEIHVAKKIFGGIVTGFNFPS